MNHQHPLSAFLMDIVTTFMASSSPPGGQPLEGTVTISPLVLSSLHHLFDQELRRLAARAATAAALARRPSPSLPDVLLSLSASSRRLPLGSSSLDSNPLDTVRFGQELGEDHESSPVQSTKKPRHSLRLEEAGSKPESGITSSLKSFLSELRDFAQRKREWHLKSPSTLRTSSPKVIASRHPLSIRPVNPRSDMLKIDGTMDHDKAMGIQSVVIPYPFIQSAPITPLPGMPALPPAHTWQKTKVSGVDEFEPGSVQHRVYLSTQSRTVQDNLKRLMARLTEAAIPSSGAPVS